MNRYPKPERPICEEPSDADLHSDLHALLNGLDRGEPYKIDETTVDARLARIMSGELLVGASADDQTEAVEQCAPASKPLPARLIIDLTSADDAQEAMSPSQVPPEDGAIDLTVDEEVQEVAAASKASGHGADLVSGAGAQQISAGAKTSAGSGGDLVADTPEATDASRGAAGRSSHPPSRDEVLGLGRSTTNSMTGRALPVPRSSRKSVNRHAHIVKSALMPSIVAVATAGAGLIGLMRDGLEWATIMCLVASSGAFLTSVALASRNGGIFRDLHDLLVHQSDRGEVMRN